MKGSTEVNDGLIKTRFTATFSAYRYASKNAFVQTNTRIRNWWSPLKCLEIIFKAILGLTRRGRGQPVKENKWQQLHWSGRNGLVVGIRVHGSVERKPVQEGRGERTRKKEGQERVEEDSKKKNHKNGNLHCNVINYLLVELIMLPIQVNFPIL